MINSRSHQAQIETIQGIADTKGIEIDDIEVVETTSDSGDTITLFRVYSTAGPKVQITKMENLQTTRTVFRDEIQAKLSALKQALSGVDEDDGSDGRDSADDPSDGLETTADTVDSDPPDDSLTERPSESNEQPDDDGAETADASTPGAHIDERLAEIQADLDEFDERLDALEAKTDALDTLEQLFTE